MGTGPLASAKSCARSKVRGYRGLDFVREISAVARANSLAIRDCYAGVPEARDKRLEVERKRALTALRRNPFYQMEEPEERAAHQTGIRSAFWKIAGPDPRYRNDCVRQGYQEHSNDSNTFLTAFRNMELVYRCTQDPAERQAARVMELARAAASLQTSLESTDPRVPLVRAAIAAIEDSAGRCLVPQYKLYSEAPFAFDIIATAYHNAEAIRSCYEGDPTRRDRALGEERDEARRVLEQNFFFQAEGPEGQGWYRSAIEAVTWTPQAPDPWQIPCVQGDVRRYEEASRRDPREAFRVGQHNGVVIRRCLTDETARADALEVESLRAIAAMRSARAHQAVPEFTTDDQVRRVVRGGKMPEWPSPTPIPFQQTLTPAQQAELERKVYLYLGKTLFTLICGGTVGLPLTVGGAAAGRPGLGVDVCTFVW